MPIPHLCNGVIIIAFIYLAVIILADNTELASANTQSRIHRHLRKLNKPAVSSIQSPDGDIIDCIPIHKQPAFDHPLLKDHKLQMEPNFPTGHPAQFKDAETGEEEEELQVWRQKGAATCPQGSIPMRRTTEADIRRHSRRGKRVSAYGRKSKVQRPPMPSVAPPTTATATQNGHQHAIAYTQGGPFYGAKATINVWNPTIQVASEFSLSQLWILSGAFNTNLNSIEVGWQVSPDLYGDNNTRLFIYWTSDSYQTTGCYNLLCSGFVQVNNAVAMGATITPISTYGSSQFDIAILVWKDPKEGNWWLQFGNKYILGYWPSSLFTSLSNSASIIEWGGEVVDSEQGGQHTTTQMGSGHFPSEGFSRSSYFSHLQVVDASNNLVSPTDLGTFSEKPSCYDVESGFTDDWGNYFYYGGPGRNANCP